MRRFGIKTLSAEEQVVKDQGPTDSLRFAGRVAELPSGKPGVLKLSGVTIDPTDTLFFNCIGDSGGVKDPNPQLTVSKSLAAQQSGINFMYHVGDVVYFFGEADEYYPQFYEPYEDYNLPIFAIPGNHDGLGLPSLAAFVDNFCAKSPHLTSEAQDSNRDAMTQPYVYWALECNLAYFIGLYSNVPSGGVILNDQEAWFEDQVKNAPTDRALIVSLHHPPYSADAHHGGSARMANLLDKVFASAKRYPEMVLTGHVHNYQRFERVVGNKKIPYFVNGAGGYHNLHKMAKDNNGDPLSLPWTVPSVAGLSLQAYCDKFWGYLKIAISSTAIGGHYVGVDKSGVVYQVDSFNYPFKGRT